MAFGAKIKLSVDKSNKSDFRGQIQQLVNEASASSPIKIKNLQVDLSGNARQQIINQLKQKLGNTEFTIKIQKIDASSAVAGLRKQLTNMLSGLRIEGLKDFLGDVDPTGGADKAAEKAKQAAKEVSAAFKEIGSLQTALNSSNKKILDLGTGKEVEELKAKYRELSEALLDAKKMEGEAQAEAVRNASSGISALNEKINAIKRAKQETVQAAKEEAAAEMQAAKEKERADREREANDNKRIEGLRKIDTLLDQINKKMANNPKTKSAYGDQIDALIEKLRTLRSETENELFDEKAFSGIKGQYQKILTDAGETGNIGRTVWNILAEGWEKFGTWTVVTRSMTIALNTMKKMVSAVKEVDKAMTELRKVTDLTASAYDKLYQRVADTSREIGASVSDMINAVADFARLGFNISEAEQLAKAAVVYKNVGDGIDDISQATESIISTMKAFGVEANNSMRIVDEFNEVGNKFAISSTGIGDALQRSAASLATAGNTLEQSIGLIVAANNVVQNPETVGTSLKTISMYLRAAKTEAEEAGIETEGMAESVSKLREEILALTGNKVDIQIDENNFKSTYQILKELSEVWDSLTDISKANLMEKLGGKRGGNVVSALLTNFSDAEAAMKAALDSVGSAMNENEKWLDSIEGRTERLSAAFQKMSNGIMSSDVVGAWVTFQEVLANIVTTVTNLNLLFPILLASTTAILPLIKALADRKTLHEGFTSIGVFAKSTAGKVILALSAIATVIGIISKLNESYSYESRLDDANTRVEKLRQEYENTENEIQNLNSELDETIARMNELEGKDSLTIVEKDELETLKATNIELTARIANLKRLAEIQHRELAQGIKDSYRTEYQTVDKSMRSDYYKISRIVMSAEERSAQHTSDLTGVKVYGLVDQEQVIDRSIQWLKERRKQISDLQNEISSASGTWLEKDIKELDELQKEYDEVEKYLVEKLDFYQTRMEEYAQYSTDDDMYKMLKEQADALSRSLYPALYKEESFNKIISSSDYLSDVEKIKEAQQAGNAVTAETILKYEDLAVAFEMAGISAEEAAEQFNAIFSEVSNAENAVSDYQKFAEKIKSISDASEGLNKVFGEQGYGSSITTEQYDALIKADKDFAECIDNTNGYMQLNAEAARKMVAEKTALEQASIEAAKAQKVEEYKKNTDAIAAQQIALSLLRDKYGEMSDEYQEHSKTIQNTIEALGASNSTILQEIQGYERLASELDYATSAYKRWIDAQDSPEAGDDYDNLRTAVAQLQEGLKSGKIGTNVFKSAAALLIPEWNEGDVAAVDRYMSKLERYFTEDATGLQHFIDDMFKNGILDDGGDEYLFKAGTTIEQIADKMGLTVDAARYMVQALQDYGWDVSVINDKYNTAELITQYEAATATVEQAKAALDQLIDSGANEEQVAEQTQKLAEAEQKAAEAKAALNEANGEAPKTEIDTLKDQLEQLKEAYETLSELKIGGTVDEEFSNYISNIQSTINLLNGLQEAYTINVSPGEGVENTIATLEKIRESIQVIVDNSEATVNVSDTISDDVINKLATIKEGVEAVAALAQTNPNITISSDDDLSTAAENATIIKEAITALEELSNTNVAPHTITVNMAGDFYDKLKEIQKAMDEYTSGTSIDTPASQPKTDNPRSTEDDAEKLYGGYSNLLRYTVAKFVSLFDEDAAKELEDIERTAKNTSDNVFNEVKQNADGTVSVVSKETGEIVERFTRESGQKITESIEDGIEAGFANPQANMDNWQSIPIDPISVSIEADTEDAEREIEELNETAQKIIKQGEKDTIGSFMQSRFGKGNVDLLHRPIVDMGDGTSATVLSTAYTATMGTKNGTKNIAIMVTPITPDGKVLTEQSLDEYVNKLIGSGDILHADAIENGGKGLVIATQEVSESMEEAIKQCGIWGEALHELQAAYYGLQDSADIKKYYEYDSAIEALRAFEDELRSTGGDIDQTLSNLGTSWDKVKNDYVLLQDEFEGLEINPDINEEEFKEKINELYGYGEEPVSIDVDATTSSAVSEVDSAIKTISGKTATFKVYGKYAGTKGISSLFGLKLFAKGTDNAKEEDAIVGEKGVETWIHDGKFRTVGNNGPELVHLSKGDQILNNLQTKLLFGNGSKAFSGNAYDSGKNNSNIFSGLWNAVKTGVGALASTATTIVSNAINNVAGNLKTTAKGNKNILGKEANKNNSSEQVKDLTKSYAELNEELEHLIEHQEQLYTEAEKEFDFSGMRSSLEEQARLYKQIMENAYAAVEEMRSQGKDDTDEDLQDMERAAWSAYNSMYDAFDKIRALYTDSLNTKIDDIQTGYSNLKNVLDEIKNNGGISVDTFQALTQHGVQYLSFLRDANGQYQINTESVQAMIAAEKEQLAVETALSYLSSLQEALSDGQTNRVNALVDSTQQISDNTWNAVYAQAALLKSMGLTDEQYNQVIFNIETLRDLAGKVITDLSAEVAEAEKPIKKIFEETKDELEHLIEHQEQLYKEAERGLDYSGMRDSLEEQARLYREIMESAYRSVEEMKQQGMTDIDSDLQDVERAAWSAYNSLNDALDGIRALYTDALNEKIDNIQTGFENLKGVLEELQDTGGIAIDTFQALTEHGLQYMSFLKNSNGQYEINTERIHALVNAEKEQLSIETALSYVGSIQEALSEGQIDKVNALVDATQQIGDNTWDAVYAQVAMLKTLGLSDEQYDQVIFNIQALRDISSQVVTDIATTNESISKQYEKINSELDHLIEHQQFLYQVADHGMDYTGMESSLMEQANLYKRIMDNAYRAVDEMKHGGMTDMDEEVQAMERAAWSAYNSMNEAFEQIKALKTDALHNKIDDIQSAYESLQSAMDEINETGYISLDTFQGLAQNGLQYMSFLENVNGQYNINADAIQRLIAVEKEQLAIETALSYLTSLHDALEAGEENKINALVNASQQISAYTWDAVYAQAALLQEIGLTAEQYDQVLFNLQAFQSLSGQVETNIAHVSTSSASISSAQDDTKETLEKILEYTEDMIKAEVKDHIKAIEKEVKLYQKIIDRQKESLRLTKEQDMYERDVAEKVQEIARIQSDIDRLSLDDSRASQAERAQLLEELKSLQGDLAEYQSDHAYDAQESALDKMSEAYEEERQKEIDALESTISSEEKVYQLAIERIRNGWDTLYNDLILWNIDQGNVINSEITENWNKATQAAKQYGGYLQALNRVGGYIVDGTPYEIPQYHSGGIVGDAGSINKHEVMAVLEKGETVLDDKKQKGLYRIIDFHKALSEKLGNVIGDIELAGGSFLRGLGFNGTGIERTVANSQNMVYSPAINVVINHNGSMKDADAKRYGNDIAETALDKMYSAFEKRGIAGVFNARLKQA